MGAATSMMCPSMSVLEIERLTKLNTHKNKTNYFDDLASIPALGSSRLRHSTVSLTSEP